MNCPDCHHRFKPFRCPDCKEYVMHQCHACHADTTHDPGYWDDDEIDDAEDEWDVPQPPAPPVKGKCDKL